MAPKISLCLIARDEAENIARCLASAAGLVDEIIVVDTGSADNTGEIARKYGARVESFLWNDNFSDARNVALEIASGDWILILDADEELAPESGAVLRSLVEDDSTEGYFVKILNYVGAEGWLETCPDVVFRLFRKKREYRFRGAIHEQIVDVILKENPQARFQMAGDLVLLHHGYLDRHIAAKDKKNRNLQIIQKELARDPENRLLRYHYGVELFRAEKFAQAAGELIEAANGTDPQSVYFPKLLRYIVIAYYSDKEYGKALDAAGQALQWFPDYADLYYYAGLACLETKKYAQARDFFLRAVTMPEQPAYYASFGGAGGFRSYFHLGKIAEMFLDYETALGYYLSALRDNPRFTAALENMVRILNPRRYPEDTRESLAMVVDFSQPGAALLMGDICYREGAYGLALEYFEECTRDQPASPDLLLVMAICLLQQNRFLEARKVLDGFGPGSLQYPHALVNKMFCFWIQGKRNKIRATWAELCAQGLAVDTFKVLSLMVETLTRKKITPVVLGPDGISLLLDILKRTLNLGEEAKALSLVHAVAPASFEGYHLAIARLFYEYGLGEQGRAFLEACPAYKDNAEIQEILGDWSLAEAGAEAEAHYRNALELNPEEPGIYVKLLRLYEKVQAQI